MLMTRRTQMKRTGMKGKGRKGRTIKRRRKKKEERKKESVTSGETKTTGKKRSMEGEIALRKGKKKI